jgi:hypothetical protein
VLRDRAQLISLSIQTRSIPKASYARHCRNTNVVANWAGSWAETCKPANSVDKK